MFMSSSGDNIINISHFCSKLGDRSYEMFLLVSGHHVGAHPDGHQHDDSIQTSTNLSKTFLRISRIEIPESWRESFAYLPPFIS